MPEWSFVEPIMPKWSFVEPIMPEGSFVEPIMPEGSFVEPIMPEGSFVEPIMPEGSFVEPTMPEGSFVEPTMPEGSFVEPIMPEGSFVEPILPEGSFVEPILPEGSFIEPIMNILLEFKSPRRWTFNFSHEESHSAFSRTFVARRFQSSHACGTWRGQWPRRTSPPTPTVGFVLFQGMWEMHTNNLYFINLVAESNDHNFAHTSTYFTSWPHRACNNCELLNATAYYLYSFRANLGLLAAMDLLFADFRMGVHLICTVCELCFLPQKLFQNVFWQFNLIKGLTQNAWTPIIGRNGCETTANNLLGDAGWRRHGLVTVRSPQVSFRRCRRAAVRREPLRCVVVASLPLERTRGFDHHGDGVALATSVPGGARRAAHSRTVPDDSAPSEDEEHAPAMSPRLAADGRCSCCLLSLLTFSTALNIWIV